MENKTKNSKNKKRKGFTLIELMIVIAILGLLIAMLVPSLVGYRNTALKTTTDAEASAIETAVMAYEINEGKVFDPADSDAKTAFGEYLPDVKVEVTAGDDIWGLVHDGATSIYTLTPPTNNAVASEVGDVDQNGALGSYTIDSIY